MVKKHLIAGVSTAPANTRRQSWVEEEDGGDKMMLVKDRDSSPVLVKIIRALTPKGRSSSSAGNGRPAYGRQSSVNRVFQIVKEGLDGVSMYFDPIVSPC